MTGPRSNGFTLLAVGDLHLGRRPSGLPPQLQGRADALGPEAAWDRLVREARSRAVDAVVLAGDVVESEDDLFEGYRALERGVESLSEAGIAVVGVAGNHDVRVLPRLADRIEGFRLLGRSGRWEQLALGSEQEQLTLHGWSFTQPVVETSPLEGVRLERGPGLNLGLLHCDLDASRSPYAPVRRSSLETAGLDGWLLGHIHRPDALDASAPLGYLGSVTGLHPGEVGDRGPWALSIEHGRIRRIEQWLLAPLHWHSLALDLTGLADAAEAEDLLLDSIRDLDAGLGQRALPPEACGLRIRLVGRSALGGTLRERLLREPERDFSTGARIAMFIERVELATTPLRPLQTLARDRSPVGLLAARLLLLERADEDPERRALIEHARRRLEAVSRQSRWQGLNAAPPDNEQIVAMLRESAGRMLETLLAQTSSAQNSTPADTDADR
ncbi:MAG: DNA repair exonuclease [Gammaproteobacteria bacterium HGW-Gammaproteobacteria-8]|nr:MAG: DNA repair exonuclease [Gammaproteobacteria bacterium HGW-Gammaproteobacteria-8]